MKPKLELTWVGKENRPRLEPRILLEDSTRSYHAAHRVTEQDLFGNRLIFGDNLLALKALEQEFTGKIKCIYIDPPFNTQQAFEHYEDGIEHSLWLSLMRDRLELLRHLLSSDGTLFVHIDDGELGYLIALVDEVFGRSNRLYVVTFKQGSATGHKAINPGCVNTTNFILIFAKDKSSWRPNRVFTGRERDDRYAQFIENVDEPHDKWRFTTLIAAVAAEMGKSEKQARALVRTTPEALDDFVLRNSRAVVRFAKPDYRGVGAEARRMIDKSESQPDSVFRLERKAFPDIFLKGGQRILFYSDKIKEVDGQLVAGEPLTTLWDDVLSNNLHAEGGVEFPKGKKPEALIKRMLDLATAAGDWVLDSFAGSGTTGAVAHKMGRQWIMVELGEHCQTHIIPRLHRVLDGQDAGGVTGATDWKGGGGFRYFRLAPSLLEKDRWGNWVVSKKYNGAMLAEALCKLEGFTYAPSETVYWQHGHSTERDFIYVTTQKLSRQRLAALSEEVGDERSLLVYCMAFRGGAAAFANLTVKKIPNAVLHRCEWSRDDYSLQVATLPPAPDPERPPTLPPVEHRRRSPVPALPLFEGSE